jgi:DNA polymerase
VTKQAQLEKLAKKIRVCQKCRLWKTRNLAVPGEGNPNSKILFIGESPGREEDKVGKPFVGMSGKFLDKLLAEINLPRKKIFITSVIKCHPPKNRNPKSDELVACRSWWQKQLGIIKPKFIILLGMIALREVLKRNDLSKCHGQQIIKNKIIYFPTFHPAAGRRFPKIRKKMIRDFQILAKILNCKISPDCEQTKFN